MASAVARGETLKAEEAASTLQSLLLGTSSKEEAETKIAELTAQRNSLQEESTISGSAVTAPAAGFFTTDLDGYEYLTPDRLEISQRPDCRRFLLRSRRRTAGPTEKS